MSVNIRKSIYDKATSSISKPNKVISSRNFDKKIECLNDIRIKTDLKNKFSSAKFKDISALSQKEKKVNIVQPVENTNSNVLPFFRSNENLKEKIFINKDQLKHVFIGKSLHQEFFRNSSKKNLKYSQEFRKKNSSSILLSGFSQNLDIKDQDISNYYQKQKQRNSSKVLNTKFVSKTIPKILNSNSSVTSTSTLPLVNNSMNKKDLEELNLRKNINIVQNLEKIVRKKTIVIKSSCCKSQPGTSKDRRVKINQDNYLIMENIFNLNFSLYAIFDGHGINGHFISKALTDFISKFFQNQENLGLNSTQDLNEKIILEKLTENENQLLKDLFIKMDDELRISNYEADYSGSTANILIILKNKLISANVGDSRSILISDISDNGINQNFDFTELSRDHRPNIIEEKMRIFESGGIVDKLNNLGPYRVWVVDQDYPGLAMSRSIGDFIAKSVGVINVPDIGFNKIDKKSKFLVMASDGVWDYLSNDQVMELVLPYYQDNNLNGAVEKIINEATLKWEKDCCKMDDITCLIIFLNK